MADHYLRKYATATTIDFALYKLDGTGLKIDAESATGDIKIMKDEGAEANTTADAFVDEGQGYSLALTATEMTAARVVIYIVDLSSPQVWLDKQLIIETYGNASAQIPNQDVNVASIDNIDFGATMKASINTEVDNALNTAIPASNTATSVNDILLDVLTLAAVNAEVDTALNTAIPASNTADSVNDILLDTLGTDVWATGTKALTDKAGFSLAADQSAVTMGTVTTLTNKTGFSLAADQSAATIGIVTTLTNKTGFSLAADQSSVTVGTVNALATAAIDTIWDEVVEGTLTIRQALRLMNSMLSSKSSGGGTATLVYRDFGDTKARLTFTADADGNRTAVTADAT